MQDKLMGDDGESSITPLDWTTKELKKSRRVKPLTRKDGSFILDVDTNLPIYRSEDAISKQDLFGPNLDEFTTSIRPQDLELVNYYESLGFTGDDIMYHSSPDIVSDKIKAIGTYYDGTAYSPIYPKPKYPVSIKGQDPIELLENTKTYLGAPTNNTPQPSYRIHDYMKMEDLDPSFDNRDMWAKMLGIKDYKGTGEQNEELIKRLKEYKKNPIRAQRGNGEYIMYPGGEYQFPGDMVYETPLRRAQQGMQLPTKDQIANDPELMNWDNYNTPLTKKEEKEFKKWMKEANIHTWDRGAYDIQGYWKEQVKGKGFDSVDDDGHRPDTYKKPNHPTFSMQSKYADHPGVEAGFWDGPDYYAPSTHRNLYGLDYYDWMNSREPDRPEKLAGYMEKPIIVTPKQEGGEFQKLVKKYTTKGWQSLTDQEKQTYKEMYKQYK
jgi:hypothetical protein